MATVTQLNQPAQKSVILERRTVYGADKMYPACERSLLFAQIAGTKTVSSTVIELIRDLGFFVVEKHGRSIWPNN